MSLLQPARVVRGKFQNPVPTDVVPWRKLPAMLRRLVTNRAQVVPIVPPGPFRTDPSVYRLPPSSGLRITLLGHSSVLVEMDGTTLLIDPVFSRRASAVEWAGPQRFFPVPLAVQDLPPVDAVLLTHDHYDHLDAPALKQLDKRTPLFVCSLGVDDHLARWGVGAGRVRAMNWMDRFVVPSASATPLELTALPARHFSGRGLKRFGTLWSSFALRTERHNVYHGADSGYWPGFQEIGNDFGPFNLALLEIGAFDPLWEPIHLGPDNALRAALDLRARAVMPVHWGCFNLAFHAWDQPPERFTHIAAEHNLPVFLPEPGAPTEFTGRPANSLWWRRDSASHAADAPGTVAAPDIAKA